MRHAFGQAPSNVSARDFKAFAGPRTRGPDQPPAQWPVASPSTRSQGDAGSCPMDRRIPEVLGGGAGFTRQLPGKNKSNKQTERKNMTTQTSENIKLKLERLIKAPRERVFKAWT